MKRAHDDISDAAANGSDGNGNAKGRVKAELQEQGDPKVDAALGTAQAQAPTTASDTVGVGNRRKCPYLDTINRNVLDFDFEKVIALPSMQSRCSMQFVFVHCSRPFVHFV